jgi:uncharacterized protein
MAALAISAVAPWAVIPLLMIGGVYLCYEGFEKLVHNFLHGHANDDAHHAELTRAWSDPAVDLVSLEKAKIKGAVRTDFILSAEIIVITLGVVANAPFTTRVAVLVGSSSSTTPDGISPGATVTRWPRGFSAASVRAFSRSRRG